MHGPGERNLRNKRENFGEEKILRLAAFTKMLKTIISLSPIYSSEPMGRKEKQEEDTTKKK